MILSPIDLGEQALDMPTNEMTDIAITRGKNPVSFRKKFIKTPQLNASIGKKAESLIQFLKFMKLPKITQKIELQADNLRGSCKNLN